MPTTLRGRRRATAAREILAAAREHVAKHGPGGLSLRAVARSLGMTVQALYHYFPSRTELLTALITEAYVELATAIETAIDQAGPGTDRFVAAAGAYRTWAIENQGLFELLYGTPLRQYQAPRDGGTTDAARRLGPLFINALFADLNPEQLGAVNFGPISPVLRRHIRTLPPEALEALPPPAAALFVSVWAHIHGLVALEVFGHTTFIEPLSDLFRTAILNLQADARRRLTIPDA